MRLCSTCNKNKLLSDFYSKQTQCKSCSNARITISSRAKRSDRNSLAWLYRKLWKLKNQSLIHGWEFDLDIDFIRNLYTKPHKCAYCGRIGSTTFNRKDNLIGHTKGNFIGACLRCNVFRGNRFSFEEMQLVGKALQQIDKMRVANKT